MGDSEGGAVPAFVAEEVAIGDLRPHPRNYRRHPEDQLAHIEASIRSNGFYRNIVVARDGTILAGHGVVEAARRLGIERVPVVRLDVAPDDPRALRVLAGDNEIGKLAEVDDRALTEMLREIKESTEGLLGTGVDAEKLLEMLVGVSSLTSLEDPGPEESPDNPVTRPGDLWLLGDHRLLCGDSTKAEDMDRLMAGAKARLLQTDPPYGVSYTATKDGIPRFGFSSILDDWGDIEHDDLDGPKLQEFLEQVFRNAARYLYHAAWYLWHAHLTQGYFAAAAAAAQVLLHRQIIWRKPSFVLTRSGMWHWTHEPCFFGWIKGSPPPWYGDKSATTVWDVGRDSDRGYHPTQKPVELFAIPMKRHTLPGEICLEPFCGSGSQIIAAEKLRRRCYAIEIEPRFVDAALRRWEKATGREAVLESTGRTFAATAAERCQSDRVPTATV